MRIVGFFTLLLIEIQKITSNVTFVIIWHLTMVDHALPQLETQEI